MTTELVPLPTSGRTFVEERVVSIADAAPDGRMTFDAILRFLGDVGNADTDDAGFAAEGLAWVARRAAIRIDNHATGRERLTMTTWCSGTGKRWAERRTSITGDAGGRIEASALWVHLDPKSGRPANWSEKFAEVYLPAAQGREVNSRLSLPKRSPAASDPGVNTMLWRFRQTDLDVFDHVNNAAYMSVLEEALGGNAPPAPLLLQIEWHKPALANIELQVIETFDEHGATLWLTSDDTVHCVIRGGPVTG